ncbi:MAG: peptide deformylase [Candidatus Marinimicrobia bacterium]|nr:peptide deformylase [Candidatus Neomarinimicrobiota bacterium]
MKESIKNEPVKNKSPTNESSLNESIVNEFIKNESPLRIIPGDKIKGCNTKIIPVADRLASLGSLASEMMKIMIEKKSDGLAASQIGVMAKMFVCRLSKAPGRIAVVFDPEYYPAGKSRKKKNGMEWSVSYPAQAWAVPRYRKIRVRYTNHEGGIIDVKLKRDDAIMFQHYTDLINGVTIKPEKNV